MKLPNIVLRGLTGAIFVGVLVGSIVFGELTYVLIFSLITALALYEFYDLIEKNTQTSISKTPNIVGGVILFLGVYFTYRGFSAFLLLYFLYVLIVCVRELYKKREDPIKSLAYTFFGQIYIALLFASANCLVFFSSFTEYLESSIPYNYVFLLAVFVLIWVNDTFAYLTGMMFGKHRLFERISPKKSWEGFFGGVLFAMGASVAFYYFTNTLPLPIWIGFALVVVAFGTWGDLVESLLKRTLGVKDSGKMIPGHGGILDRFDSTLFAIPAAVVYLELCYFIIGYLK